MVDMTARNPDRKYLTVDIRKRTYDGLRRRYPGYKMKFVINQILSSHLKDLMEHEKKS